MKFELDTGNMTGSDGNQTVPKSSGNNFRRDNKMGDVLNEQTTSSQNSELEPKQTPSNHNPQDANTQFPQSSQQNPAPASKRSQLIQKAKDFARGGPIKDRAFNKVVTEAGMPSDLANAFKGNSPEQRERAREIAKQKTRDYAKEQIGKRLKGGVKKGFEKGLEKGTKQALKEGAKKATKQVAKQATKQLAKQGAKVATKTAVQVGTKTAEAAIGAGTFGLGFILSFFLDIAISLGVNDAVDAMFELKEGHAKEAKFLAERAAMKVLMFIILLLAVLSALTIVAIFTTTIPALLWLNTYMLVGSFGFTKKVGWLQGLVGWEKVTIIFLDLIVMFVILIILVSITYGICSSTGLLQGGVMGTISGLVLSGFDWVTGSSIGGFMKTTCSQLGSMVK